ncbi:MAG: hypothetical protein ACOYM2_00800 [Rectinemataceae bacterium]
MNTDGDIGPGAPLITYSLAINEREGKPIVETEILQYRRGSSGQRGCE